MLATYLASSSMLFRYGLRGVDIAHNPLHIVGIGYDLEFSPVTLASLAPFLPNPHRPFIVSLISSPHRFSLG